MRRVLAAAAVVVVATAAVGLMLRDDDEDLRRVGLPTLDETVATVLDDGTPVFVTRDPDDEVRVTDARTPARPAPEDTAALADLVDGLVAWCADHGFVDDLAPPAGFGLDGRALGTTDAGLGVYEIAERARAHVMVARARPPDPANPGRDDPDPEAMAERCDDPERTDDHGQAMHDAELDAIPAGSAWVVEAAVDLGGDVLCEPPPDPLAWPVCPDGGVPADLADHRPAPALGEAHGQRYAQRDALAFVGRFLVQRDADDGPLQQVWRLPYGVEVRAEPTEREAEAAVALVDGQAADTVAGDPPLATLAVASEGGVDGDLPQPLAVESATEVVIDGETSTGEEAVAALRDALDDDPEAHWKLALRHDPLRPPRLERLERLDG